MSDIFLSYKSEDKEKAYKIAKAIEQEGYSVWVDRIIPLGTRYDKVIQEELDAANCVVVLWSNKSVDSDWVYTEAIEAFNRKILFPVFIENVKPPFIFRPIEAADLVEWDGTSSHHEFQLLLDSIRGILNRLKLPEQEVQEIKKQKLATNDKDIQVLETPELEVETFNEDNLIPEDKDTPVLNKPIYEIMQERMVEIPAGKFLMGDDKYGRREVTISAFKIDKFPVTQDIYERVMHEKPSHFKGINLPMENIRWFDAIEFCNELSKKTGLDEAYEEVNEGTWERKLESDGYRLPTEAEWEYACRANTPAKKYGKLDEIAWYGGEKTHEVGQYPKGNEARIFDMLGNVWEWCEDRFGDYPNNPKKPDPDPTGPDTGPTRILRGGSWVNYVNTIKCTHRSGDWPTHRNHNIGFRLVLPLNQRVTKEQ